MAKAKTTPTPKKGRATAKARASATPDPPLRRSPRKAVQSAKKAEAERSAKVTARVTKKASPAKKTSTIKKLTNAFKKPANAKKVIDAVAEPEPSLRRTRSSPATKKRAAAKTKSPSPKEAVKPASKKSPVKAAKTKSPAPKKAVTPVKSATATPRPRGRPRKSLSPAAAKSFTASPNPRDRPPKNSSPAKVTNTKASPKKSVTKIATKAASTKNPKVIQVSNDSKSITEDDALPATRVRSASSGKTRIYSAPSRLESPAGGKRNLSVAKARSKSPAKAAAKPVSPHRASDAGVRARSQSPAKSSTKATAGGATRTRSKSPAKITKLTSPRKASVAAGDRARPRSPAKGARRVSYVARPAFGDANPLLHVAPITNRAAMTQSMGEVNNRRENFGHRPSSPRWSNEGVEITTEVDLETGEEWEITTTWEKKKPGRLSFTDENGIHYPGEGESWGTKAVRKPRRPSNSPARGLQSPLRKTIQSPIKAAAPSPAKVTARSSKKLSGRSLTKASPTTSPTKKTASSTTKASARSPTKARKLSADARWDAKFNADDSVGKALRMLEKKAYQAKQEDRIFNGSSMHVSDEDCARARQHGIARAKEEFALRHLADSREQRVREGYEDRGVVLDMDSSSSDNSGAEIDLNESRKRSKKASSPRHKASSTSQPSPAALSSSHRSSASSRKGSASTASPTETFAPLPPGQPSSPGRGATHSSTNPEYIAGTKKKNPFFETMPGPEYWHRNQPPYFMFGETPYTAQHISRQINEDLKRGAANSAAAKGTAQPLRSSSLSAFSPTKLFSNFMGQSKSTPAMTSSAEAQQQAMRESPFKLPEFDAEKLNELVGEYEFPLEEERKRTGSGGGSPEPKRPGRVSGGNGNGSRSRSPEDRRMSGAL